MKDCCIAGFGEVMLRLCPEGKKRFAQVLPGELQASFGGAENVCAAVATQGEEAIRLLPDNPIAGAFAISFAPGCDTSAILFKDRAMGVYYAEHGSNMRGPWFSMTGMVPPFPCCRRSPMISQRCWMESRTSI